MDLSDPGVFSYAPAPKPDPNSAPPGLLAVVTRILESALPGLDVADHVRASVSWGDRHLTLQVTATTEEGSAALARVLDGE